MTKTVLLTEKQQQHNYKTKQANIKKLASAGNPTRAL